MQSRKLLYYSLLLLMSCSQQPDTLGKLDVKKWRSDRGGCNGVRASLVTDFKGVMQEVKGKHVNDITEIFGRPDINQIAERNQKYYIYFLEKGPQCDQPGTKSTSQSVALRISAIGLVTEITFQQGIP